MEETKPVQIKEAIKETSNFVDTEWIQGPEWYEKNNTVTEEERSQDKF